MPDSRLQECQISDVWVSIGHSAEGSDLMCSQHIGVKCITCSQIICVFCRVSIHSGTWRSMSYLIYISIIHCIKIILYHCMLWYHTGPYIALGFFMSNFWQFFANVRMLVTFCTSSMYIRLLTKGNASVRPL
jgi:hypothetical protein